MSDQTTRFKTVANYAHQIFSILLDPNDILTMYGAKKLLHSSSFIYNSMTRYISERNATIAIFIAVNMAVLSYQYAYASWFMYFVTTSSGLKKLYRVLFKNPILGIFFFASFYFKILEGTADVEKFNMIAKSLGLPIHENFVGQRFISSFVDIISNKFGDYGITGFKSQTKKTLRIVAGLVISGEVEKIGVSINNVLLRGIELTPEIKNVNNPAVYITKNDVFHQAEMEEYSDFLDRNMDSIKKEIKGRVGKKKKRRKLELQRIIEKKDSEGNVVCLSECKNRIKTKSGCYCEGDCGKSFLIGKESWCYVDPTKCKRTKALLKYRGKTYDRCDASKLVPANCWTGTRWKECRRR